MPELTETRFGRIEYLDEDVLTFPDGLVGFPDLTGFIILSTKPESPFRWLQSLEAPAMAILLADPCSFVDGYEPVLGDEQAAEMKIGPESPTMLFTTATIPNGKPDEMTLNLAGPIVINLDARIGKQFILEDEAYTIKYRVVPADTSQEHRVAA